MSRVNQSIDHASLARLAEAGSLAETHVVGQAGGWSVIVRYGTQKRVLSAQRGRGARVFKKMDTLVSYLKDIGISKFDVNADGHEAAVGTSHSRPDRAKALRTAHEAAARDAWFRAEVRLALDEADSGNAGWVSHDEVAKLWAEKRKSLEAKAAKA